MCDTQTSLSWIVIHFVLSPSGHSKNYSQIYEVSTYFENFDSDDFICNKNYYLAPSDLASEDDIDGPSTSKILQDTYLQNKTVRRKSKKSCNDSFSVESYRKASL
jgi:hypothetical protein